MPCIKINPKRARLLAAAFLYVLFLSSCADDPDPDISGKVVDADGAPAAGVDVMIAYHLERLDTHAPAAASADTNRIYLPSPNPSCDGIQTIHFELADPESVTMFARSLHGLTDYDLLFMEPYPPGTHQLTYQMIPGLYEINATFVPDTLVSFIVPETAFLEWDRDGRIDCPDGIGFPAEKIDVTDNRGRFSVNREELIWRPRIFEITGEDGVAYKLGIHAALFVRPSNQSGGNPPVPATHIREIDLTQAGHFIELTKP